MEAAGFSDRKVYGAESDLGMEAPGRNFYFAAEGLSLGGFSRFRGGLLGSLLSFVLVGRVDGLLSRVGGGGMRIPRLGPDPLLGRQPFEDL